MTTPATFPIAYDYHERRRHPEWPAAVPWSFVEPLRAELERKGGTLEMVAARGGASPQDLYRAQQELRPDELDPTVPTAWYVEWLAAYARVCA